MELFNDIIYDLYRFTGKKSIKCLITTTFKNFAFRKLLYYRILNKYPSNLFVRFLNYILSSKISIELVSSVKLGKGTLLLHPYGITFNSKSKIGDNFTILKGATIGNCKTGKIGAPQIGNNVYVGPNSSIVGGIKIGNNVMIAPNTFVNFDVPDDSIVIGNPGVIHTKKNASAPYIVNSINDIVIR